MLGFSHSLALRGISSGRAASTPRLCSFRRQWRACAATAGGGVTREQVEKVVRLAQLELSDGEVDQLTPEFNKIVGFIDSLSELELDGVEPMSRVEDSTNVLRDDNPAPFANVDTIVENVPSMDGDFIRVPKIGSESAD